MNLGPTTLRQWADARAHLSKAIQTYVSATAFLESMCTPLLMESIPDALNTIEDNIEIIEREQLDLQRAQATLKKKRNSFTSPIDVLPSEMLACIFTTAATPVSEFNSSEHYVKRTLSRVCSRWRHIALEVCPIWSTVSLVLEIDSVARGELEAAVITLSDLPNRPIRVPVHRQDSFDDTLLVQKTLDTIAPYIRQLGHLDLNTDNIEQLQPFLDLWLEKGTPSSLRELCLSADEAALAFSEAGSHLSKHLSKSLRHLELLKLSSVGLDWSSVSFKRLTSMTLSDLPPFCCPTLVQLARMLSTCHDLQTLRLERITILASPGVAPLEPVELKYLERLSLEEVDTSRILSILSPGHCELHLELQDLNNDADMLESLRRFAGQANIRELDLMFSETRSDATLAQLLHLTTGPLLDLIYLKLIDMDLRNSELDVLAGYSLMTLPPASISDTSGLPRLGLLEFQYCTIHTAPASFHNAITAFPWITLRLANCRHSLTTQDENNINEVLEPISDTSDFGIQLSELLPDRTLWIDLLLDHNKSILPNHQPRTNNHPVIPMNQKSQAYGVISSALQQWVHARIQFSKAIQAYISATTFLESTCTPFSIKSIPEIPAAVESNLKIMERDQFDLHRTQAALKRKRNSCMSPIYALPAEILAIIFTAAVPSSCFDSSEELVRKNLSHVCSHWRQVALEVCPVWRDVSLALKVDNTSDGKLMMAEIGLNNTYGWEIHAPIHHPPSASNTQYIQIALDTITPYIKRLGAIDLNTDSVEQLRPFLNLWLEKGSLRSVRKLYLSAKTATLVFPETNMRLSDRFSQCLRRISNLFLCSVGLDWSSVAFDRLRAIRLVGLPLVCCPSVVQLARVLSTCPGLWSLDLEHITFPASSDATPEPVELRCLQYICLKEVDISSVLVVISAKSGELVIELRDIINDDMLEALLSFARRSSISKLALTLSDTRSDQALSRLLHPVTSPLLGIQRLTLGYMSLRDSELNDLATHSFDRNDALLSSVSIVTTIQPRTLELWICTINTTPEALRDAIFTYPWQRLTLSDCYHSAIMQGADGATEVSNQINSTSDFGIRLNELIPGRAEFQ